MIQCWLLYFISPAINLGSGLNAFFFLPLRRMGMPRRHKSICVQFQLNNFPGHNNVFIKWNQGTGPDLKALPLQMNSCCQEKYIGLMHKFLFSICRVFQKPVVLEFVKKNGLQVFLFEFGAIYEEKASFPMNCF